MKITIFGLTLSSSWGNGHATPYRAVLKALAARGHDIAFYEKDVEYYALRRDFSACDYCNLVLYSEWADVRERALRDAAGSDVVITASYVPSGAAINDEVLGLNRPLKVFYDLDTPVTLAKLESGAVDYVRRDQIPEFDLVLSWTGGGALEQLQTEFGARLARPLFGCVDPDVYVRVVPRIDLACELSYMGTYAADRQHKVDGLFLEPARRNPDRQFLLAGSLYPWRWQWPGNVRRIDHVSPSDHPALYSSSRLTLNITRADMAASGYCPSGRLFEAAACGTPILSDWFNGLDAFYRPGHEILIVDTAEDVLRGIAMDDRELAAIANQARQRTLDEHTGAHRAGLLLTYLEEARSGASARAQDILEAAS